MLGSTDGLARGRSDLIRTKGCARALNGGPKRVAGEVRDMVTAPDELSDQAEGWIDVTVVWAVEEVDVCHGMLLAAGIGSTRLGRVALVRLSRTA